MWYDTTARSSAPKRSRGDLQVARGAVDRLLGIEALVDRRALGPQPLGLARRRRECEIRSVSAMLAARSTHIPSRSVAVEGMIWARPEAASGVGPAITSGRPALSRKITASSVSGSTPWRSAAASICVAIRSGPLRRGDDAAGAHLVDHVRGARRRTASNSSWRAAVQASGSASGAARRSPRARSSRPADRAARGRRARGQARPPPARPQPRRAAARRRRRERRIPCLAQLARRPMLGCAAVVSREPPTPDRHDARPRRVRGAGARARRRSEGERLQVRRHRRRRHLRLGDPLGEGRKERHGRDPDRAQGRLRQVRPRGRAGKPAGQREAQQRQHGPEEGQEARRRHGLQVPLLHGRRPTLRNRPVHDRPRPEVQADDPLRALGRPGRAPVARPVRAVLEPLRGLGPDPRAAERLQRAHGRHDLLGHRGPGLHARRRRPDREAEVGRPTGPTWR